MKTFYRGIEELLAPRAVIASVSSEEKEQAESLREAVRTVLVPNYSQVDPRPLDVTSRTIVTVGRILPQKDPRFFMETVRHLRSDYDIIWIGDGDPVLRQELISLGIDVTGWLPMDDLVRRVGRAGLYLHTASWEGSPLATLEAINSGTAVLSRDIPSMRSVGYEVPSATPHGLAAAVEKYFADPSYRETVFNACKIIQNENSQLMAAQALRTAYSTRATQPQETT
ncbi:glycosyltransferase [Kocuria rosea]|nr:glycosyltransferase [Kocuria rosea]